MLNLFSIHRGSSFAAKWTLKQVPGRRRKIHEAQQIGSDLPYSSSFCLRSGRKRPF